MKDGVHVIPNPRGGWSILLDIASQESITAC